MVRLSKDLRQSVVFLGFQKEGREDEAPIDPRGVGLLLWGRAEEGGGTYLVTARHVAEKLTRGLPFVIRFNKIGGGSDLVRIDSPSHIRWFTHPDETVDLAVAPIDKPDWSDNVRYQLDSVIQYDHIRAETGAGDAVYISGLFHFVHGSARNLPVVYRGTVALSPSDERLPVKNRPSVEGYLVQANPISGCSGAPVWVHRAMQVEPPQDANADPTMFWVEGPLALLGFWSSSWKIRSSDMVTVPSEDADADEDDRRLKLAPLGMGVVVPANKLIEIFEQTNVARERAEMHRKKRVEESATPDFLAGDDVAS